MGFDHFAGDHAVLDEDHAVCVGGGVCVVGDHEDGLCVVGCGGTQQAQHLGAGVGVEVTGRFVGEDHFGACKQGAHDGDALLLTAGELFGAVVEAGFQAEGLDQVVAPLRIGLLTGEAQRQVNVLARGEGGYQVERLEDEADVFAAELGEGVVLQAEEFGTANTDGSCRVRVGGVQGCDESASAWTYRSRRGP